MAWVFAVNGLYFFMAGGKRHGRPLMQERHKATERIPGKTYQVLLVDEGSNSSHLNGCFLYDGALYKSLTAIANRITGKKWNGGYSSKYTFPLTHPHGAMFHLTTPLNQKLPVRGGCCPSPPAKGSGGTSASMPQASTKTDWAEQRALLNR